MGASVLCFAEVQSIAYFIGSARFCTIFGDYS